MADADRETWRDMIERLREAEALDADQETVLFRFFSEGEVVKAQALERISAEFAQRTANDGEAEANAWLQDTGRRMGREDREETERMLSSLGVELPPAS